MKKWLKIRSDEGMNKYLNLIASLILAAVVLLFPGETAAEAKMTPVKAGQSENKIIAEHYETDFGRQTHFIRIHKLSHKLEVFEKGKPDPVRSYDCAVGKNPGDKQRAGDKTTPVSWGNVIESAVGAKPKTNSAEIPFVVDEICHAGHWSHDFKDGEGVIHGAYGPWFISLNTGWDGIGIHGTNNPESIGTNATEGCIRLRNEDVDDLKKLLYADKKGIGVRVVITED